MDNILCSAPDRIGVPARPAQHVHRRLPHMRRRTRRSAATIGGGTPDMTVGRAAADRAGARPYPDRRAETRSRPAIKKSGVPETFEASDDGTDSVSPMGDWRRLS